MAEDRWVLLENDEDLLQYMVETLVTAFPFKCYSEQLMIISPNDALRLSTHLTFSHTELNSVVLKRLFEQLSSSPTAGTHMDNMWLAKSVSADNDKSAVLNPWWLDGKRVLNFLVDDTYKSLGIIGKSTSSAAEKLIRVELDQFKLRENVLITGKLAQSRASRLFSPDRIEESSRVVISPDFSNDLQFFSGQSHSKTCVQFDVHQDELVPMSMIDQILKLEDGEFNSKFSLRQFTNHIALCILKGAKFTSTRSEAPSTSPSASVAIWTDIFVSRKHLKTLLADLIEKLTRWVCILFRSNCPLTTAGVILFVKRSSGEGLSSTFSATKVNME